MARPKVEPRRNEGGSFQKELPMAETEESRERTEKRKEDLDRKLDQQLEETFPTSDPPVPVTTNVKLNLLVIPSLEEGRRIMAVSSEKPGEGVNTSKASDLRDHRQGAYDQVGNQKKPNASASTERERRQTGGSMQGEPIPTENFDLPEGLKRQPLGPYNRDKGRSNELPDHVPKAPPKR
jgi:hypothetical protein